MEADQAMCADPATGQIHSQLDNVALADFIYGLPAVSRPIIREWFRSGHDVEWKADDSPVTMADKSVELAVDAVLILTRHRDQLPLSAAISASVGSAAGASACWRR